MVMKSLSRDQILGDLNIVKCWGSCVIICVFDEVDLLFKASLFLMYFISLGCISVLPARVLAAALWGRSQGWGPGQRTGARTWLYFSVQQSEVRELPYIVFLLTAAHQSGWLSVTMVCFQLCVFRYDTAHVTLISSLSTIVKYVYVTIRLV